jgi:hypothetical protein
MTPSSPPQPSTLNLHPSPSPSPLFSYPAQAAFNKVLPKNKLYAHSKPTRRIRQWFTDGVAQIVWKYKLAPETIRTPAKAGIEEIQVFGVTLKSEAEEECTEDILRCIDTAIGFPILFELETADRIRAIACFKRPSEIGSTRWVVGEYFMSQWLPLDAARSPLPVALDLASLYAQLLRRLMPHPARAGESLRDHAERLERIRSLEREYAKLEVDLNREKQFNRKVEVHAQARAVRVKIDELTA